MLHRASSSRQNGTTLLKLAGHPKPDVIRVVLEARGVMEAYAARPPCQRNDRPAWIARANRHETRAKPVAQMADERAGGERYTNMAWRAGSRER